MGDAAEVGRRVLSALAAGRRKAITQAQARRASLEVLVAAALRRDAERGLPARGRAGRISRALRGLASERHVRRLIHSDALSNLSDSVRYNCHDLTDKEPRR